MTKQLVLEFHQVYGAVINNAPTIPDIKTRRLRVELIASELQELANASGIGFDYAVHTPGTQDFKHEVGKPIETPDMVEIADALGDLDYVVQGSNISYGLYELSHHIVAEIHRANMSKLGADSKPIYREDGKVLKGPNYTPPDIARVLRAWGWKG